MTDVSEALPLPEARGRLDIADTVVETIARQAAATVSTRHHVSGLSRIISHNLPHARVSVTAGHVEAALTVAAGWPTPASSVARRVQEVVAQRIGECTGLTVVRVDVEVHFIPRDTATDRKRVQ